MAAEQKGVAVGRLITTVLIVATTVVVPWMALARPNGGIGHREPTDFIGSSYGSQSRMATRPDVWGVTDQLAPAAAPAAAPASVSVRSTAGVTEQVLGDERPALPAGPAGPGGPAGPAGPAR